MSLENKNDKEIDNVEKLANTLAEDTHSNLDDLKEKAS